MKLMHVLIMSAGSSHILKYFITCSNVHTIWRGKFEIPFKI